jgi:plasmid stability protein
MPSVQIKDVPDDVHTELRRRAAKAGKSLQEYLLGRLTEDARTPSLADVLDRVSQRRGGRFSVEDAASAVRAERDAR